MEHKLTLKKTGLNPKTVFKWKAEYEILDATFHGSGDICFLTKDSILLLKDNEITPYLDGTLNNASSMAFSSTTSKFYVVQDGGREILAITDRRSKPTECLDANQRRYMGNILSKLSDELSTKIKVNSKGDVFFLVKEANRIFKKAYSGNKVEVVAGNGFANYSQNPDPRICSLNFPESFDEINGKLLICDTGNHIIRSLHDNRLATFFGSPKNTEVSPRQIFTTKDFVYFSDNNVYMINQQSNKVGTIPVYETAHKTLIFGNKEQQSSLYILESYG